MTYDTKTIFPAQENVDGKKHTTTKQQDTEEDIEKADVIKLYNSYREGGYKVSVTFTAPPKKDAGDDEEISTFEVEKQFTLQCINDKAQLNIKYKRYYD